jgi:toxin YoeB
LSGSSQQYRSLFTRAAQKDARKLNAAGLRLEAAALLAVFKSEPLRDPPPFEQLVGNLSGAYSRRINIQHRLVYQILEEEKTVKILRMWTHYE